MTITIEGVVYNTEKKPIRIGDTVIRDGIIYEATIADADDIGEVVVHNRTELELHCLHYFKSIKEPITDKDLATYYATTHILEQYVDGYKRVDESDGRYVYADSSDDESYDNDAKLIEDFIRIAKSDIEGSYEYNYTEYEDIIEKALAKFGL